MKVNLARIVFLFLLVCFVLRSAAAQPAIRDLEPTVILLSLDGFHPDYLNEYQPPTLNRLARRGVRAEWLIPAFPSKTFPNHYTVATGLYPDRHGIIENNMYDREIGAVFGLSVREQVENPRWWGDEPIWVTAERQNKRAAAFFFPGTETLINNTRPTYWKTYQHDLPNEQRVDAVLGWLDLPKAQRPRVVTMYFSDVDDAGHAASPRSEATRAAVLKVDANIKRLMDGLKRRKIERKVNLIVVSDHGMAPYRLRDAIVLDDFFAADDAERIFWVGEFTQIFPKAGKEEEIYRRIKAKLPATADIYRRGEFPARYKFGSNSRIAPLVVVPKPGTVITNRKRFNEAQQKGTLDVVRGGHGYDNADPTMRALFIAHGKAFKKNLVVKPFENVEIYNLMTRILGLSPAPNDGDLSRVRHLLK